MGKLLKFLLYAVAALVVLLLISAVLFTLLFDANDFRDKIAVGVKEATGRELVIEGNLDVSVFPWLAIDVGRAQLGNAEGFGDEPFASFEQARLSVRLLPLLLRREVSIGTAELDSLSLNLVVKRNGRTNWQDLAERGDAVADEEIPPEAEAATPVALDIASISVSNANLRYENAQLGERYLLTDLNINTGAVEAGEPINIDGSFGFKAQPADTSGTVKIETLVAFDPDSALIGFEGFSIAGTLDGETPMKFVFSAPAIELQTAERVADLGAIRLAVLDVTMSADIEPFSYADSPQPVASIRIDAFSPRGLMQKLLIDPPETADPNALGSMIVDAKAVVTETDIRLSDVKLKLDDTTLTGTLVVPRSSSGTFRIDLAADEIDLNRYMEPVEESAAETGRGEEVPVEIPVDLIRAFNARGNLTVARGTLDRMQFDDVTLGLNMMDGQMRLHPLSAHFFDGSYQGDIRINAAANVPVLSVNEQIQNVSLGALATAMFEKENITGQINGNFRLEGRGHDMTQIQRTLHGNMSFVLSDGAWEGVDVWYQLRRARALFRKETPPEPTVPARTRFSEVSATGVVNEGVMRNDDFRAELPFMQLTGKGTVDFPTAMVDYSLSGRVLEKPEFTSGATAEEIDDLTRAVIPLKITGPLSEPSFKIDFGALIRKQAEEKVKDVIFDKLLGGDDEPEAGEGEEGAEGEEQELDPEEELKDALKDLLGK